MKKYCTRVFDWVQLQPNGNVHLCPWNFIVIGNLKENTLEEIWHSKIAEETRKAFIAGELLGCDEPHCVHCLNHDTSMMIYADGNDFAEGRARMEALHKNMPNLPNRICISFDERCNHACPSCRHGMFTPTTDYMKDLKKYYQHIAPYLSKAKLKYLDANGGGEFFCSTELTDMLADYKPTEPDFFMRLESNGVMFKDNWHKVAHLGKYMKVSVTPSSFNRATYKYLAGGKDDLEKFEESMEFITELKEHGKIKMIEMTMVIQDSNFREIPDFVHRCLEKYHADIVILRPIFKWFHITDDELLYKNVANPCHPYYQEYLEILKDPILNDKRVQNWGIRNPQQPVPFPTLAMRYQVEGGSQFKKKVLKDLELTEAEINIKLSSGQFENIVLYGVGKVGKILFEELTCGEDTKPVSGFLVQSMKDNPKYYMGKQVQTIADNNYDKEKSLIIIALGADNRVGVKEHLIKSGFSDVIELVDSENSNS